MPSLSKEVIELAKLCIDSSLIERSTNKMYGTLMGSPTSVPISEVT